MQKKIAEGYSKNTSFAAVLRLIDEFRISCPAWEAAKRDLVITAVVPEEYLPPADTREESWEWGAGTVTGLKNGERPATTAIERVTQLILGNVHAENDAALVALWELWVGKLSEAVLPGPTAEVASIIVQASSDVEYTYKQHKASETLDFSVLSDSYSE